MLKRLAKKLTHNLGLKLVALLFAVGMWMAVVNLDDPTINKPFTIAVTIENEDVIASMGKYFEVINESGNVTFNVSGKRSIVDKLSVSDFKATADMNQLIQQDDTSVVPIEIVALRYASQLTISRRGKELQVSLEDLMRAQFIIQPVAKGEPADGYALGSMEVTPNLLKVSGPKAIVSEIESVKATIDISDMTSRITDSVVPALLDKDGEAVDTTRLTMNISTVTVNAEILVEKNVAIRAGYSGDPEEGFEVIAVTPDPEEIKIKGTADVLNGINAITIPDTVINVDGVNAIFTQQIDITKYLPSGVTLSDSSQANITVKVDVEQLAGKTFTVPVDNIDVDNLPEGYRIMFGTRSVEITIFGLNSDLSELTATSLRPVLDVEGVSAGSHVGQLTLNLDSKFIVADTTVPYTIITEPDTNASDGDAVDDSGQDNDAADTQADTETGGEDGNGDGSNADGDTTAAGQGRSDTNTNTNTNTDTGDSED